MLSIRLPSRPNCGSGWLSAQIVTRKESNQVQFAHMIFCCSDVELFFAHSILAVGSPLEASNPEVFMAVTKSTAIKSSSLWLGSGMAGFRALPKGKGKRPAVILLHERYGLAQHTKDLTVKLARAGYVAIAPDLFWRFTGDRKALSAGDARVRLRDSEVVQDIGEVLDHLKALALVDASRVAIIGVCATGRHSILLQAHRSEISAAVVFYGAVGGEGWSVDDYRQEPLEKLIERLSAPLLGIFGEADHGISIDAVKKLRACLEQYKKSYHIKLYAGAPHGWLNDTMPGRYRKEAARDAWQLLLAFLKKTLGSGWDRKRILYNYESNISPNYDFTKNVRYE
jgi:carboxymethylenebutenolidase